MNRDGDCLGTSCVMVWYGDVLAKSFLLSCMIMGNKIPKIKDALGRQFSHLTDAPDSIKALPGVLLEVFSGNAYHTWRSL